LPDAARTGKDNGPRIDIHVYSHADGADLVDQPASAQRLVKAIGWGLATAVLAILLIRLIFGFWLPPSRYIIDAVAESVKNWFIVASAFYSR